MVDLQTQQYLQQKLRTKAESFVVSQIQRQLKDLQVPDLSTYVQRSQLAPFALKTEIPQLDEYVQRDELDPYALKTELPIIGNYYTKSESDSNYPSKTQFNSMSQTVAREVQRVDAQEEQIDLLQWQQQQLITQTEADQFYIPLSWKNQVENQFQDIYKKEQSDNLFALKTDSFHPDLMRGYYTINQSNEQYVPKSDMINYATQQDLTSRYGQTQTTIQNFADTLERQKQVFDQDHFILMEHTGINNVQNRKISDCETRLDNQLIVLGEHLFRLDVLDQKLFNFNTEQVSQTVNQLEQRVLALEQQQNNQYTKSQTNALFALQTQIPDLSQFHTKNYIDQTFATKQQLPNFSEYSTTVQADSRYMGAANAYTKTESDARFPLKADVPSFENFYTKGYVDTTLAKKSQIPDLTGYQTTAQADLKYPNRSNVYSKTETDERYVLQGGTADLSSYYSKTESDQRFASQSTLPDMNLYQTKDLQDQTYAKKTDVFNIQQSQNLFQTKQAMFDEGYMTQESGDQRYALQTLVYDKTDSDAFFQKVSSMQNYYSKAQSDANYQPVSMMSNYYLKSEVNFNFAGKPTVDALVQQIGNFNIYTQGWANIGDVGGGDTSTNQYIPCNGVMTSAIKRHQNAQQSYITLSWIDRGMDVVPLLVLFNGDGSNTDSFVNDMSPVVLRPQTLTRTAVQFLLEETGSGRTQQCQVFLQLMPAYNSKY